MARLKGSKNKPKEVYSKLPYQYQFVMPRFVLENKAKRIYWLLREMEAAMARDITCIKPADYYEAVTRYADICDQLKATGYKRATNGKLIKPGVDTPQVAADSRPKPTATVGGKRQASLGVGISAPNPLT